MKRVLAAPAALAGALMLASCGQEDATSTASWTADIVALDCCTTSRLPSPSRAKTLIFEPDSAGRVRVTLSAGWLRRQEIAVAAAPVLAAWGPRSEGLFLSDGRPGRFRLFRTPDNGAASELTPAPAAIASAYRAQAECSAAASEPELRGLGWSADGRRVLVLASAPSCRSMVVVLAAGDGGVVALHGADEAARRFGNLLASAAAPDVTAP